jgi:hypothetical protein
MPPFHGAIISVDLVEYTKKDKSKGVRANCMIEVGGKESPVSLFGDSIQELKAGTIIDIPELIYNDQFGNFSPKDFKWSIADNSQTVLQPNTEKGLVLTKPNTRALANKKAPEARPVVAEDKKIIAARESFSDGSMYKAGGKATTDAKLTQAFANDAHLDTKLIEFGYVRNAEGNIVGAKAHAVTINKEGNFSHEDGMEIDFKTEMEKRTVEKISTWLYGKTIKGRVIPPKTMGVEVIGWDTDDLGSPHPRFGEADSFELYKEFINLKDFAVRISITKAQERAQKKVLDSIKKGVITPKDEDEKEMQKFEQYEEVDMVGRNLSTFEDISKAQTSDQPATAGTTDTETKDQPSTTGPEMTEEEIEAEFEELAESDHDTRGDDYEKEKVTD